MDKCFFCDCIIIPRHVTSVIEMNGFFKQNKLEYTLNHNRSKSKIGNKLICMGCEMEMKELFSFDNCDCEKPNEGIERNFVNGK